MKKNYSLLIAFLFIYSISGFGQSITDSIQVKQGFGTMFRQNDKNLTPAQLSDIVKGNPEAYQEMQKAKTNSGVATVLGYTGGFLIGYPIGAAITGKDANWSLAGIGAGILAISIPFVSGYTKHATKAAKLYNSSSNKTSFRPLNFQFGMAGNGFAFELKF